jgi:hypothetical protein
MDVERSSDLSSIAPDDSVTVVSGRDTVEVQLDWRHDQADDRVHNLGPRVSHRSQVLNEGSQSMADKQTHVGTQKRKRLTNSDIEKIQGVSN